MSEHAVSEALYEVQHDRAKFGMWLFLASEIMFFTGFIGSYIVLRMNNAEAMLKDQDQIQMTLHLAIINTVALILSSLTMAMAVKSAHERKQIATSSYLFATILLACVFMVVKFLEYKAKFDHGLYPSSSPFFSCYFTMTGFHGLHVLAGIVALLGILGGSMSGAYTNGHYRPVEITGLYWHLVDLIWIFLFPMLYLL
jgi:cytochrome c oxidase subunit 3